MAIAIRIDREACHGRAACVRRAPGTFALDGEGKSVAADAPREPDAIIREAAAACPFFAIHVTESENP